MLLGVEGLSATVPLAPKPSRRTPAPPQNTKREATDMFKYEMQVCDWCEGPIKEGQDFFGYTVNHNWYNYDDRPMVFDKRLCLRQHLILLDKAATMKWDTERKAKGKDAKVAAKK